MPDQTVTVNSAGGADFTVLQTAIDDSDVTDGFYKVEIENNAAYAENLTAGGSTGTPTISNYLWITATDAAYHGGVFGTGARVSPSGADHSIEITEDFVRLEKLLVEMSTGSGDSNECIRNTLSTNTLVERCLMDARARSRNTNDGDCYYCDDDAATPQTLYNCVMIDADRAFVDMFTWGGQLKMEFCTGYLCCETETSGGQNRGFILPRGTDNAIDLDIYNTVGARNEDVGVDNIWAVTVVAGTLNASHNASSDADSPGTNSVNSLVEADAWTDPTNFDLTIKNTSSALYQAGTDRSASKPDSRVDATIDIRGETRPSTPSIGAYEFAATSLSRATETDAARTLAASKTVALGRASETDAARALTTADGFALGRAIETSQARALAGSKSAALGRPVETSQARALAAAKTVSLGRSTESDAARAFLAGKTDLLGRAVEADAARALPTLGQEILNRATETDSARALSPSKTVVLGRATEIDAARPLSLTTFEPLGRATETGNARGLTAAKSVALGRSAQADAARLLAASKTSAVGKATETDQARGFGVITGQSIGRVSEADSARTFSTSKVVALGRATETDAARSFLLGIPDPNVVVVGQAAAAEVLEGQAGDTIIISGSDS